MYFKKRFEPGPQERFAIQFCDSLGKNSGILIISVIRDLDYLVLILALKHIHKSLFEHLIQKWITWCLNQSVQPSDIKIKCITQTVSHWNVYFDHPNMLKEN
uniref:Uncharacterized protein n=1 Tax=Cacopsylla melanoneura TaxID=428564 RepID=A0A8D9BDW2_9HEMI